MAEGEFGGGPFNRLVSGIKRATDAFTQTSYSGGVNGAGALSQGGAAQQLGKVGYGTTPPVAASTTENIAAPAVSDAVQQSVGPTDTQIEQIRAQDRESAVTAGMGGQGAAPYTSITKDANGNPVITSIGGTPAGMGGGRYFNQAAQAAKEAELDNIINTAMANRSKTHIVQDLRWNPETKKAELVPVEKVINAGRDSQLLATALAAKYGMGEKRMNADVEMEKARMGLEGHKLTADANMDWRNANLEERRIAREQRDNELKLRREEFGMAKAAELERKELSDFDARRTLVGKLPTGEHSEEKFLAESYHRGEFIPQKAKEGAKRAYAPFESAIQKWEKDNKKKMTPAQVDEQWNNYAKRKGWLQ